MAHQTLFSLQSHEDHFFFQRCKEPGSVWPVIDHPKASNSYDEGKKALNNELSGIISHFL